MWLSCFPSVLRRVAWGVVCGLCVCTLPACGDDDESPSSTQARPKPARKAAPKASAPASAASASASLVAIEGVALYDGPPRDVAALYQDSCALCHEEGVAAAPRRGDSAAWAPVLARGSEAVFKNMVNGLNAMPPKGTLLDGTEDEMRALIAYISGQELAPLPAAQAAEVDAPAPAPATPAPAASQDDVLDYQPLPAAPAAAQ